MIRMGGLVGGWLTDRSLLTLHLIWAELGSLSPLPHSHTNLGLVLQPIIYPGEHSKPAQARENLHRNLDSWWNQSMSNDKILK